MKLEASHPGGEGKTIVQKMQDKADAANRHWRDSSDGSKIDPTMYAVGRAYGRWEGLCAGLGILRGSSTAEERRLSEERIEAAE